MRFAKAKKTDRSFQRKPSKVISSPAFIFHKEKAFIISDIATTQTIFSIADTTIIANVDRDVASSSNYMASTFSYMVSSLTVLWPAALTI